MKRIIILVSVSAILLLSAAVSAEPRTVSTTITKLRPYTDGSYFVTLGSNALNNATTCTTVYLVQSGDAGANAVIASLLTAFALGSNIQIELPTATGCEGFATPIQSVFITP